MFMSILMFILGLLGTIIFWIAPTVHYNNYKKKWGFFFVVLALSLFVFGIAGCEPPESNGREQTPPDPKQKIIKKKIILNPDAYDIPALETAYRETQQVYNKQLANLDQAKQRVAGGKKFIDLTKQTLNDSKAIMDDAWAKLKEAQKRVRDNPDLSTEPERAAYRQAKIVFDEKNHEVKQLQMQVAQAKKNVEAKQATINNTQNEINRLKRQLKIGYFAHFKAKVEKEKIVEGYGEAGCNQQHSISKCKNAARQVAIKDASQKGAVILLDSETWASLDGKGNWKLTKDEIRTQLRAVVIGHEVLDDNVIGKCSAYYYKIRATVKGQVPPKLQQQLVRQ